MNPFSTNPDDYLILTSVEDNQYMCWQLELLIYSFTQMGRPSEERVEFCRVKPENICAVVHSEKDGLSKYFLNIVDTYGIKYIKTKNYGTTNIHPYFRENGIEHNFYKPKNKACSLGSVYSHGMYKDYKFTMLTDCDVFAYKFLNTLKFPTRRTSIAEHWLCDHPIIDYYPNDKFCNEGVNLLKLMESMHVPEQFIRQYVSGGCLMWVTRDDLSEQLVNSISGYVELIRSVCHIIKQPGNWCVEMPAYALGMATCGIKAELIHEPEFSDSN